MEPTSYDTEGIIARYIICRTISPDIKHMLSTNFKTFNYSWDDPDDKHREDMHKSLEKVYRESVVEFASNKRAAQRKKVVMELEEGKEKLAKCLVELKMQKRKVKRLEKEIQDLNEKGSEDGDSDMDDSE